MASNRVDLSQLQQTALQFLRPRRITGFHRLKQFDKKLGIKIRASINASIAPTLQRFDQ